MFLGQETPSPSCTLYLSAHSPIFIRLYLRLESVPLHFLLRSSSSFSASLFFFLLLLLLPCSFCMPLLCVSPPGTDAVTTTCKHSGICNSNATKRGRETAAKKPQPVLALPRERVDPTPCERYTARYSISPRRDKLYFGRTRAVHEKRIVSKRFQYFSPTTPASRLRVIVLAPGIFFALCASD